ncbi:hypothetical protein [Brachybacterium hainanense]|uniref:Uncharacterized protein n=1 Tax=Brachybacterium hainanense TaxID=1541174 RepID=A0ABV6R646_9MICO
MAMFLGADTDMLRDVSMLYARRAELLQDLGFRVHVLVETTTWTGEDAESFRTEWSFRVRPRLADAALLVRRRGLELAAQAGAQDGVSAPEASGPMPIAVPGPTVPTPLGRFETLPAPVVPLPTWLPPMPDPPVCPPYRPLTPEVVGDIGWDDHRLIRCEIVPGTRASAELGAA